MLETTQGAEENQIRQQKYKQEKKKSSLSH